MIEFPKAPGTAEPDSKVQREIALRRSDRGERVFDTLIEVLEETPEVLSLEYSADLLCDLVCSRADVTTQEVVAALEALGARVMALRELMQERAPARA